jgi:hypothetical protein
MAFGYDGSIRIKADLSHRDFDKGISSMKASVDRFSGTLRKMAGVVTAAFGVAAIINFGRESVKAASELSNAWLGLQSIVEGQGRSFKRAKSFVEEYVADGLVPLTNAVTAYKNLAARGYGDEQIQKTMIALKDAAAFGRQSTYTLGEAIATATEGLKNENSILVDNAGVTKNVAKMWDDYAKSIGTTANRLTKEQKIQAEVNGILEETKFQTGDAAKLVNTYSGQVAMLSYNFQQLKVAVGNALMPIVQAVLPGINAIIAALVKLANVFAKVTALLFGKPKTGGSSQVKEQEAIASSGSAAAGATDKLTNATKKAGEASKKAAKEMKGVQAGFDELDILADSAADSMGDAVDSMGDIGGGDIDIPEPEIDGGITEKVGEEFSSLGELFVDTLDKILASLPALREALLNAARSFNEFNQKLYDAFTFPGVQERVERLGRELAEILNDFVDEINWELWGRTLGAGLNLGLQFLTEFLYKFDWVNLGHHLAEFINGLVYEIDWYDFGRLLWAKFKIALETLAGFILGLDMPALAKAASDTIMGFFDEMKNTIDRIEWGEIGTQIAEFLNNIDWIGVITSIAGALESMVNAGLDLISSFIQNADPEILAAAAAILAALVLKRIVSITPAPLARELVSQIIKKIAEAMTSSGFSSIIGTIGKTIGGITAILGGVALAVSSFVDMWNNGFSLAKEAVMLLGIALAAVGAVLLGVPATVAAIVAGIVAVVASAVLLIREHWDEIKEAALNVWESIKEAWSAAGEWFSTNVVEPVAEFFSGLWTTVSDAASAAWEFIQGVWTAVSEWFHTTVIEPVSEFFSNLWEDITTFASDAWAKIQEIWAVVSSWFNDSVVTPVKEFFKTLWEDVKKLASDAWDGIVKIWEAVSSWFDQNVVQPIKKLFTEMWDGIKQKASDIWEGIKKVWSDAKSWFEQHVTGPLGDAFTAAVDKIKESVNGAIGKVEGLINSVIKGVNWLIEQLNKIKFDVPDWVPFAGGSSFSINIPKITEVKLPRLANGAVIPPNQQFAAILGDQRSGKNIEAPVHEIEAAVMRGIQSAGGIYGNPTSVTVILEMDKRELGRTVYALNRQETQRVGVRLAEGSI